MESLKREAVEAIVIIGGLIVVQVVYAGNSVLLSYVMSLGLNPLTIVIFSSFAAFLILSPLSIYFERSNWPKKFSLKLLVQLVLISFSGVTLFQSMFLKGIKLTSPGIATAMPNLGPGLVFFIAVAIGLEKVKLSCMYSKVKILGTLLCIFGALTMSFMQSSAHGSMSTATQIDHQLAILSPPTATFDVHSNMFNKDKILGCLCLMAAVFASACSTVLQATTLREFPAPMTLCAVASLIAVILTAILELIQYHQFDIGWPIVSVPDLIGYSLLGGTVNGVCVSFSGWAMKKRGPVLVSMFSPIATVVAVVLSYITIREQITLGSFAGMFLMFTGLYFFLWAKGKEDFSAVDGGDAPETDHDAEKPLLS